jgi:uncharacterized protein YeaO (DUF488 family)
MTSKRIQTNNEVRKSIQNRNEKFSNIHDKFSKEIEILKKQKPKKCKVEVGLFW